MSLERWVDRADRALDRLARTVESARPTPIAFQGEVDRLREAWRSAGATAIPRFEYAAPVPLDDVRASLAALRSSLPSDAPLYALYAARIDELVVEADLADPALSPAVRGVHAARRFGATDGDRVAASWLDEAHEVDGDARTARVRADDPRAPDSLVSLLRAELGRVRAPARIVVTTGLAALAAYKDGVVFVAKDRLVDAKAARRTVLHEVHGHVLPDARARDAPSGLFRFGSARGSDDQEGFALLLEERGGFLDRTRRTELASRHAAAKCAHERGTFVDAMRALLGAGVDVDVAVRASARAFRGARDGVGGLGRERVYLSGLVRVRDALADNPELEAVIASGRLSVEAARELVALRSRR